MRMRGNLLLLLTAFIWGTAFVAQVAGMAELGPLSYAAGRFTLGFFTVLLIWWFFRSEREQKKKAGIYFSGWKSGLSAGVLMFIASTFQQVAMLYTTAGKTAFITALYIVLVPICTVVLKQKIRGENWTGAFLALTGLYFLAMRGEFVLQYGDLLVLVCAFFWTFQILWIDHFAAQVDVIELSVAQIGICALGSWIGALAFETLELQNFIVSWFPIFYGGVMSAGVAFTLQIVGQKYAEPTHAAIIMSFEAIFGALASWALLGEVMSMREIFGCILMMVGMIVTQMGSVFRKGVKGNL